MEQTQNEKVLKTFNGLIEECDQREIQLVNRWIATEHNAQNIALWFASDDTGLDKRLKLCVMLRKAIDEKNFSAFGGGANGQARVDDEPDKPKGKPEPEPDGDRIDPTAMEEEPEPEPEKPGEGFTFEGWINDEPEPKHPPKRDVSNPVDELESESRLLEALNATIRSIVQNEIKTTVEDALSKKSMSDEELTEIVRPIVAEEIKAFFATKFK